MTLPAVPLTTPTPPGELRVVAVCFAACDSLPAETRVECGQRVLAQAMSCPGVSAVYCTEDMPAAVGRLMSVPALPLSGSADAEAVLCAVTRADETCDVVLLLSANWPFMQDEDISHALQILRATTDAVEVRTVAALVAPVWRHRASQSASVLDAISGACVDSGGVRAVRAQPQESQHGLAIHVVPADRLCDVRTPAGRAWFAASLLEEKRSSFVDRLPARPGALVMDFDGVFTDNAVWVDQNGLESVRCDRGDGLGLETLRHAGLKLAVISKEKNPVVVSRCQKVQVECFSGIDDKLSLLTQWAARNRVSQADLVYVGNDINDLECLRWAGCGVAVADSHVAALEAADLVLSCSGGRGALRELSECLLTRISHDVPPTLG